LKENTGWGRIDFRLYLITDRFGCAGRSLVNIVEEALKGGVKAVQLREKDLSSREMFELAVDMRRLTLRYGAKMLVNDRIDIAMSVGADGVHLGERSVSPAVARKLIGEERLIGVSCHGAEEALAAWKRGADFITLGPVFFTPSKAEYGEPLGLSVVEEVARLVDIPVFAIGGIKTMNLREALSAGAHGIAVISAVLSADDPRHEAGYLLSLIDQREELNA
jgi:thiamine-phosphate pyrophosphorylase